MNKLLLTCAAGLAVSAGYGERNVYAPDAVGWYPSTLNAVGFEGLTAGTKVGTGDGYSAIDGSGGSTYWAWEDSEGSSVNSSAVTAYDEANPTFSTSVPFDFRSDNGYCGTTSGLEQNENYLKLNTEGGTLLRNVSVSNTTNIYIDTMVQFTINEDIPVLGSTDKIAIYMDANEKLCVIGGKIQEAGSGPEVYGLSTNVLTTTPIKKGEWHRLTVQKMPIFTGQYVAYPYSVFVVYVDGVAQSYANDSTSLPLFDEGMTTAWSSAEDPASALYTACQLIPAAAPDTQSTKEEVTTTASLTSVGFQGTGAIDDFVVTTYDPFSSSAEAYTYAFTINAAIADFKAISYTLNGGTPIAITAAETSITLKETDTIAFSATPNDGKIDASEATGLTAVSGGYQIDKSKSNWAYAFTTVDSVASVTIGGTETSYATFADAWAAAAKADVTATLKLAADVSDLTGALTVPATANLTLDLASKTITGADGAAAIANAGTLIIVDTVGGGKVVASTEADSSCITSTGTTTLTKGIFEGAISGTGITAAAADAKFSVNPTAVTCTTDGYVAHKNADEYYVFEAKYTPALTVAAGENSTYTVKVNDADPVTTAPANVTEGDKVEIVFYPNTGYAFAQDATTNYSFTVTTATLDAYTGPDAAITKVALTIPDVTGATANITSGTEYDYGTEVTVTWTAAEHYTITAGETENITMNGAKKAAAPTTRAWLKYYASVYTNNVAWEIEGVAVTAQLGTGDHYYDINTQVDAEKEAIMTIGSDTFYVSKLILKGASTTWNFTYDGTTYAAVSGNPEGVTIEGTGNASKLQYKVTTGENAEFAEVYLTKLVVSSKPEAKPGEPAEGITAATEEEAKAAVDIKVTTPDTEIVSQATYETYFKKVATQDTSTGTWTVSAELDEDVVAPDTTLTANAETALTTALESSSTTPEVSVTGAKPGLYYSFKHASDLNTLNGSGASEGAREQADKDGKVTIVMPKPAGTARFWKLNVSAEDKK